MKKVWLMLFAILVSGLIPVCTSAAEESENEKIVFWNEQRKGANYFSVTPDEAWFAAAKDLGIT